MITNVAEMLASTHRALTAYQLGEQSSRRLRVSSIVSKFIHIEWDDFHSVKHQMKMIWYVRHSLNLNVSNQIRMMFIFPFFIPRWVYKYQMKSKLQGSVYILVFSCWNTEMEIEETWKKTTKRQVLWIRQQPKNSTRNQTTWPFGSIQQCCAISSSDSPSFNSVFGIICFAFSVNCFH